MTRSLSLVAVLLSIALVAACSSPTPTPTATPIPTATPVPAATSTPTPTATAVLTATPTPTATPAPTATATPTPTATPAPTATPTPTATPRPTSTPRPSPTATPTPRPTATPTATATPRPTPTISPTNLVWVSEPSLDSQRTLKVAVAIHEQNVYLLDDFLSDRFRSTGGTANVYSWISNVHLFSGRDHLGGVYPTPEGDFVSQRVLRRAILYRYEDGILRVWTKLTAEEYDLSDLVVCVADNRTNILLDCLPVRKL